MTAEDRKELWDLATAEEAKEAVVKGLAMTIHEAREQSQRALDKRDLPTAEHWLGVWSRADAEIDAAITARDAARDAHYAAVRRLVPAPLAVSLDRMRELVELERVSRDMARDALATCCLDGGRDP